MDEKRILDLERKSLDAREKIIDKKMEEMFVSNSVCENVKKEGGKFFDKLKGPLEGTNGLLHELEMFPDKYRQEANMKKVYELSVNIKEIMTNKIINKIDDLSSMKYVSNNPELKKIQSERFRLKMEKAKYNEQINDIKKKRNKTKEM